MRGRSSNNEVLINALDVGIPLHLQTNDINSGSLINTKLTSFENYKVWATAMKIALHARNKIDEVYQPIRDSLLTQTELPDVKDDFVIVCREESYRGLSVGHPNETIAKIRHVGNLRFTSNVVLFDVLVIPEYTISLFFVNKMIKDIKLHVGFNEYDCVIQDLKEETVSGTASESGGFYMFDIDEQPLDCGHTASSMDDNPISKGNVLGFQNVPTYDSSYKTELDGLKVVNTVGNKMLKSFPLPKFALLVKLRINLGQRHININQRRVLVILGMIQQYLQNEHYALWEVIEFGDSYEALPEESGIGSTSDSSAKKKVRTVSITTEDMQKRRNDVKSRTTLLLALPDEHQLRFKGSETLKQTFNRLQAIVSHLEFINAEIEQDDLNQKFLTSLALEWLMYTIMYRNRYDHDTLSLDDVYNHLKVHEPEVQKKSELNSHNMAFISSANTSSGKVEVNSASIPTASTRVSFASADVVAASISHDTVCAYISSQSNGSQIKYEDINQIDEDDIEEIDIKRNMALLSMRADRFWKKTGKKITIQGIDVAGFDKSKVECFNCHKMGHFARECRAPRSQDRGRRENYKQENHALVADDEAPTEFALMAKSSSSSENEHMTGNISYLFEYEPYDGGYVSSGQGGGKITSKADKSMLWHRRLGHLNFKTMNKLVRHNLVKGLPSKCFENDHTFVVCLKGKQHKASCKTKLVNSVSKSLHTLHIDMFGPTYDETSGILRNFITKIENLKDLKVKIIRCDNGGEFKNKEMNEFCTGKGIKREFRNARTPQQNRVAERRNRTLIEAARTMLADAKLPVTFWAEAVNTTCYVQNRVLVNKSQNKTPYELFNSRTPAIGFLRPFGCHVMIFNTLDHLGKFDAKGDEGYFIGYSMSNKAFRVFNKRTRKVEENLHVDFLENKLIEKGAGLNWLFVIDSLTNSMNYVPVVVAGISSANILGTKDVASQGVKKDVSSLRYIALPNWFHEAHMESSNNHAQDACNADAPESSGIFNPTATSKSPPAEQMESLIVESLIPTVSSPVPTACLDTSLGTTSVSRLISKEVISQEETPSLDNILTLSNQFEDILEDTTNTVDTNGVEADLSNIESIMPASPTPTLRIHKDHPKSQIIEPKKIFDALKDPSWVEAMQEELLQFKIQNVWILVDCPKGEERIDYEEVFAQVARIEAIRLFLTYASYMEFTVYQMDVKSTFLYGTIDEEVYVMQPLGFQDPQFPDRVYKVEKAMGTIDQTLFIRKHIGDFLLVQVYVDDIIFGSSNPQLCREFEALMHDKFQMSSMGDLNIFLGLQVLQKKDGIFLLQDKYVGDILKKFGYSDVRSANTPMDKENSWGKDVPGKDVELHLYIDP
nr:hypothetical protein [Tanacetum cinerariifolium]